MDNAKDFRLVYVTVDSVPDAEKIAFEIVDEKLAACCNIIQGITSIYSWEGKVHKDNELLLIIKTTKDNLEKLESAILELHPYDVPEIIAFPLTEGTPEYLKWIHQSTDSYEQK